MKSRLIRCLVMFFCVVAVSPAILAQSRGDVTVRFNGGGANNKVYIGEDNILEFMITNVEHSTCLYDGLRIPECSRFLWLGHALWRPTGSSQTTLYPGTRRCCRNFRQSSGWPAGQHPPDAGGNFDRRLRPLQGTSGACQFDPLFFYETKDTRGTGGRARWLLYRQHFFSTRWILEVSGGK